MRSLANAVCVKSSVRIRHAQFGSIVKTLLPLYGKLAATRSARSQLRQLSLLKRPSWQLAALLTAGNFAVYMKRRDGIKRAYFISDSTLSLIWDDAPTLEEKRFCGNGSIGDIVGLSMSFDGTDMNLEWLEALAPYVEDGSYLDFADDDDRSISWRLGFLNGKLGEFMGVVTYPNWDVIRGELAALTDEERANLRVYYHLEAGNSGY